MFVKTIKYIDSEGFNIIKDSIGFSKEQYTDLKEDYSIGQECIDNSMVSTTLDTLETLENKPLTESENQESESTYNSNVSIKLETLEINNKYIESLEIQIEYLKSVISEKDKQLETRDIQISEITKLVENSQVLLRQQQDKIFLLESPEPKEKFSLWNIFKRI